MMCPGPVNSSKTGKPNLYTEINKLTKTLRDSISCRLPERSTALSVDQSSPFVQNAEAAAVASRLTKEALNTGELPKALQQALTAVAVQPGWAPAYRQLGEVLDRLERKGDALRCFQGEVPETVWAEYTSLVVCEPSACTTGDVERIELPELSQPPIALHPPQTLTVKSGSEQNQSEFKLNTLRPSEPYVDRVPNGSAWHDAHHTHIYDHRGGILAEHSMGSPCIVNSLRANHPPVKIAKRVFVLGARGISNYYHWMTDILPKLELCRLSGIEFGASDRFVIPFQHRQFQLDTLQRFGIDGDQIYQTHDNSSHITGDEIIVPHLKNKMATTMGRWLPRFLNREFGGSPSLLAEPTERLYISRDSATAKGRCIDNNDEIENLMRSRGFEIVLPENHTVQEQAALFSNAKVVVAPHGAGLTNIVFCRPGTKIIEFYGAHVSPCYWLISELLGLSYYNHHANSDDSCRDSQSSTRSKSDRKTQSFTVRLDDTEAMLSLASIS